MFPLTKIQPVSRLEIHGLAKHQLKVISSVE